MKRGLVAAAVLAFAACGLDFLPFLYPPDTIEATPSTPLFKVINVTPRVDEFRGFELYYKFYSRDQARETGLRTLEDLRTKQFRRMCSDAAPVSSQVPPLVSVDLVDRNSVFTTTGFFDAPDDPAKATYNGAASRDIPLRREVEEFGVPKSFARPSFARTDKDLDAIWNLVQSQGHELYLVMYGLSYGLKDITVRLYSDAQYLGYVAYYGIAP